MLCMCLSHVLGTYLPEILKCECNRIICDVAVVVQDAIVEHPGLLL